MDLTPLQITALVVTYLLFGFLGFRLSRKFKRPVSPLTWSVLIVATVLAMGVMPGAILIGAFEFRILINHSLQAIGVGVIIGLSTREIRIKVEEKDSM
jgi:amino acid transporter